MKTKTKPELDPRAVKLLRRVAKHIMAKPSRYDQGKPWSLCGSPVCICGWMGYFAGYDPVTQKTTAPHLYVHLGIYQFYKLFSFSEWPYIFRYKFFKSKTKKSRARVAASRIAHFIKTDGRE